MESRRYHDHSDNSTAAISAGLKEGMAQTIESSTEKQVNRLKLASRSNDYPDIHPSYKIDSAQLNILRIVGKTGSSNVFLSKQNGFDVIVKKIRLEKRSVDYERMGYFTEVKMLCGLTESNASNVIRFLGYDIESAKHEDKYVQSNFNIIMEFASYGTLRDFLPSLLDWEKRYEVLKGIACGLKHIHLNGIIHRDIKSANEWNYSSRY